MSVGESQKCKMYPIYWLNGYIKYKKMMSVGPKRKTNSNGRTILKK